MTLGECELPLVTGLRGEDIAAEVCSPCSTCTEHPGGKARNDHLVLEILPVKADQLFYCAGKKYCPSGRRAFQPYSPAALSKRFYGD